MNKTVISILVAFFFLISAGTVMAAGDSAAGQAKYNEVCLACHGPDPSVDGPVGPSIKGSSAEMIKLRVLEGKYPEGTTPKRPTMVMPPMPHLAGDIDNLAAFLK